MSVFNRPVTYAYALMGGLIIGISFYVQASIGRFEASSALIREGYLQESSRSMADLITSWIEAHENEAPGSGAVLEAWSRQMKPSVKSPLKGSMRVTVQNQSGLLIYDSYGLESGGSIEPGQGANDALKGGIGLDAFVDLDGSQWISVSCPIKVQDRVIGVVTSARSNLNIQRALEEIVGAYFVMGFAFSFLAFLLVLVLFVYFLRPIEAWFAHFWPFRNESSSSARPNLRDRRLGLLRKGTNRVLDLLSDRRHVEHMMYCLAHELRAPLSAVHLRAELMTRGISPEMQRQSVDQILHGTTRMKAIIDRLLKLAALENRETLKEFQTVALTEILEEVRLETDYVAAKFGIQRVWMAPDDLQILCDRTLLVEALSNLIRNGIEHSEKEQTVEILVIARARRIDFEVRDYGAGIPEHLMEKVHERFFSLPKISEEKGVGLGLAFVREVADIHYGSFTLQNAEDRGALARFSIKRWST